jgi:hypothetical protein
MKKRAQRRNPISNMNGVQELSLVYGGDDGFESKLQRRAAWFTHRDRLIELSIENIPGTRPQAFFEYEHPAAKDYPGAAWEYLFTNNLLHENEMGGVVAIWSKVVELTAWKCVPAKEVRAYRRQAKLLGKPAQDLLKQALLKREGGQTDDETR